jgi:hypothetical protein
MSDQENLTQSLVTTGRRDLAQVATANALVLRGIVDLAKLQESAELRKMATELRESIVKARNNLQWFLEAHRHFEPAEKEVGQDRVNDR